MLATDLDRAVCVPVSSVVTHRQVHSYGIAKEPCESCSGHNHWDRAGPDFAHATPPLASDSCCGEYETLLGAKGTLASDYDGKLDLHLYLWAWVAWAPHAHQRELVTELAGHNTRNNVGTRAVRRFSPSGCGQTRRVGTVADRHRLGTAYSRQSRTIAGRHIPHVSSTGPPYGPHSGWA